MVHFSPGNFSGMPLDVWFFLKISQWLWFGYWSASRSKKTCFPLCQPRSLKHLCEILLNYFGYFLMNCKSLPKQVWHNYLRHFSTQHMDFDLCHRLSHKISLLHSGNRQIRFQSRHNLLVNKSHPHLKSNEVGRPKRAAEK